MNELEENFRLPYPTSLKEGNEVVIFKKTKYNNTELLNFE